MVSLLHRLPLEWARSDSKGLPPPHSDKRHPLAYLPNNAITLGGGEWLVETNSEGVAWHAGWKNAMSPDGLLIDWGTLPESFRILGTLSDENSIELLSWTVPEGLENARGFELLDYEQPHHRQEYLFEKGEGVGAFLVDGISIELRGSKPAGFHYVVPFSRSFPPTLLASGMTTLGTDDYCLVTFDDVVSLIGCSDAVTFHGSAGYWHIEDMNDGGFLLRSLSKNMDSCLATNTNGSGVILMPCSAKNRWRLSPMNRLIPSREDLDDRCLIVSGVASESRHGPEIATLIGDSEARTESPLWSSDQTNTKFGITLNAEFSVLSLHFRLSGSLPRVMILELGEQRFIRWSPEQEVEFVLPMPSYISEFGLSMQGIGGNVFLETFSLRTIGLHPVINEVGETGIHDSKERWFPLPVSTVDSDTERRVSAMRSDAVQVAFDIVRGVADVAALDVKGCRTREALLTSQVAKARSSFREKFRSDDSRVPKHVPGDCRSTDLDTRVLKTSGLIQGLCYQPSSPPRGIKGPQGITDGDSRPLTEANRNITTEYEEYRDQEAITLYFVPVGKQSATSGLLRHLATSCSQDGLRLTGPGAGQLDLAGLITATQDSKKRGMNSKDFVLGSASGDSVETLRVRDLEGRQLPITEALAAMLSDLPGYKEGSGPVKLSRSLVIVSHGLPRRISLEDVLMLNDLVTPCLSPPTGNWVIERSPVGMEEPNLYSNVTLAHGASMSCDESLLHWAIRHSEDLSTAFRQKASEPHRVVIRCPKDCDNKQIAPRISDHTNWDGQVLTISGGEGGLFPPEVPVCLAAVGLDMLDDGGYLMADVTFPGAAHFPAGTCKTNGETSSSILKIVFESVSYSEGKNANVRLRALEPLEPIISSFNSRLHPEAVLGARFQEIRPHVPHDREGDTKNQSLTAWIIARQVKRLQDQNDASPLRPADIVSRVIKQIQVALKPLGHFKIDQDVAADFDSLASRLADRAEGLISRISDEKKRLQGLRHEIIRLRRANVGLELVGGVPADIKISGIVGLARGFDCYVSADQGLPLTRDMNCEHSWSLRATPQLLLPGERIRGLVRLEGDGLSLTPKWTEDHGFQTLWGESTRNFSSAAFIRDFKLSKLFTIEAIIVTPKVGSERGIGVALCWDPVRVGCLVIMVEDVTTGNFRTSLISLLNFKGSYANVIHSVNVDVLPSALWISITTEDETDGTVTVEVQSLDGTEFFKSKRHDTLIHSGLALGSIVFGPGGEDQDSGPPALAHLSVTPLKEKCPSRTPLPPLPPFCSNFSLELIQEPLFESFRPIMIGGQVQDAGTDLWRRANDRLLNEASIEFDGTLSNSHLSRISGLLLRQHRRCRNGYISVEIKRSIGSAGIVIGYPSAVSDDIIRDGDVWVSLLVTDDGFLEVSKILEGEHNQLLRRRIPTESDAYIRLSVYLEDMPDGDMSEMTIGLQGDSTSRFHRMKPFAILQITRRLSSSEVGLLVTGKGSIASFKGLELEPPEIYKRSQITKNPRGEA